MVAYSIVSRCACSTLSSHHIQTELHLSSGTGDHVQVNAIAITLFKEEFLINIFGFIQLSVLFLQNLHIYLLRTQENMRVSNIHENKCF